MERVSLMIERKDDDELALAQLKVSFYCFFPHAKSLIL